MSSPGKTWPVHINLNNCEIIASEKNIDLCNLWLQGTLSTVQKAAPGHMQVERQSLLDEVVVWYHWCLLCKAEAAHGQYFLLFFLFLEGDGSLHSWLYGSICKLKVSLLVWHWTCVQLLCVHLQHFKFILCFSCPWDLTYCLGIVSRKWHCCTSMWKSHIAVLKLMSWNRASPNLEGQSNLHGWAKPSPSLTDKEMFAWKEGQFSETAQNSLSGW